MLNCYYCFLEHEASLIRMFDKLTNGSRIEINETGKKNCTRASLFLLATYE